MAIDIIHVEASIRRFNKTALMLAARSSGISEEELKTFPVIVSKGTNIWAITVSKSKPDSDFYTPYIVNASFCLEILIKLILYYETKKWVRGHNLLRLYEQISTDIKKRINETFKIHHKKNEYYKKISKMIKNEASINIKWNVASLLALSSNAFENWRYAFDKGKSKSCFIGYGEIYEALYEAKNHLSVNKAPNSDAEKSTAPVS